MHKVNGDWIESIENGAMSIVCYFEVKITIPYCSNLKNMILLKTPLPGSNLIYKKLVLDPSVTTLYLIRFILI